MIGGTIRIIQRSRDAVTIVKAGGTVRVLGQDARLVDGQLIMSKPSTTPDTIPQISSEPIVTDPEPERVMKQPVGAEPLVSPPGRVPPSRPISGDTDGGPGRWESVWRPVQGAIYQEQRSGVPCDPDGRKMEYAVTYFKADGSTGTVHFDGHEWRGQLPEEIFLEAKDGYNFPIVNVKWAGADVRQLEVFTNEANDQLRALRQAGVKARVEWHFSDKEVADTMREYFTDNAINVTVVYTPKI
jgi:hypothetical protein